MMKFSYAIACGLAFLFCHASTTQADFLVNGFGLNNPEQTIGFDELGLPFDTQITNQYDGVSFSSGVFQSPQDLDGLGIFNFDENWIGNFPSTFEATNPYSVFFDDLVDSAAFAFVSNDGITEFTALLNGNVVDSNSTFTQVSDPNNFFGFEGIVFNEIQIFVDPTSTEGGGGIDNLQFNTVPEPSTFVVCAILAATALVRRRK